MAIQWAQIDLGVELSTISIYFFKSIPIDLMMKSLLRTCSCDKSPWSRSYLMNFIWKKFFGDVLRDWLFTQDRWLMMTVSIFDECLDFLCDGSTWSRSYLMKFIRFSSETFLEKGDSNKIVHYKLKEYMLDWWHKIGKIDLIRTCNKMLTLRR